MSHNNSFYRCPHDKENPYAQISRDLIRDNTISPLLRFLLIFLLSQKDGWKIKIKQVINLFSDHKIGKDKIYSIVNEGIEAGYIERTEWLEKGLKRTSYKISETPKFKKCLPCADKPKQDPSVSAQPDPAEPTLKKEHRSSKEELKKNKENPKVFEFHKISMPVEKHKKLIEDFGEEMVMRKIEALHEYSEMKAKKFREYTDHARVLRKWITEELKVEPKKPNEEQERKSSIRWKGKKIS